MLRRCAVSLAVATSMALVVVAVAGASFQSTKSASNSISSAGLAAPTGLGIGWNPTVKLSWTATGSPLASGYRILRGTTSGGPYNQVGSVTPASTVTYSETPGAGTFYYVVQSFYNGNGASWTSGSSNQVARQDSNFVFHRTTSFVGSNCNAASGGSGSNGQRDMQQGYTPGGAETTFTGAANASIVFCSDVFTTGQSMSAGTTTIQGYWSKTGGGGACPVTATIYKNGTSLGSASNNVPNGGGTTLRTWSIGTAATTFATGDRLNVKLALAVTCAGSTVLHYDGSAVPSRATFPTMP